MASGTGGPLLEFFNHVSPEFRGVLIAVNLLSMLHNNLQEFFFGVGRKSHGTFHIPRVISAINRIAFHDIYLPLERVLIM
jgi:hypothetical protein